MSRALLIVFNPASGRGKSQRIAERLGAALEVEGRSVEYLATREDSDVFASIEEQGFSAIVIVGGDGSFHGAVNGLARPSRPFGFCGTGTVNVLSLEAELSTRPEELAKTLLAGERTEIPLLRANESKFVLFAEAGFLGSIVRRVNRVRAHRGKHGKVEFVTSALRILPFAFGRPLRVKYLTAEGEEREGRYSNALATRARSYAGTMPLPMNDVTLGSRSFQFVGFRTRTPVGHLFLLGVAGLKLLPALRGWLEKWKLIEIVPALSMQVEGPKGEGVHLDAESEVEGRLFELPLRVDQTDESVSLLS